MGFAKFGDRECGWPHGVSSRGPPACICAVFKWSLAPAWGRRVCEPCPLREPARGLRVGRALARSAPAASRFMDLLVGEGRAPTKQRPPPGKDEVSASVGSGGQNALRGYHSRAATVTWRCVIGLGPSRSVRTPSLSGIDMPSSSGRRSLGSAPCQSSSKAVPA